MANAGLRALAVGGLVALVSVLGMKVLGFLPPPAVVVVAMLCGFLFDSFLRRNTFS